MKVKEKIKNLAFVFAVTAAMVWVFGYVAGWGWILQLVAVGYGLHAAWQVWTDQISPEDDEWNSE